MLKKRLENIDNYVIPPNEFHLPNIPEGSVAAFTFSLADGVKVRVSFIFTYTCQKNDIIYLESLKLQGAIANNTDQGPVVQSTVSINNSLRGQLVKCFTTLLPNILIFFVEKMSEAFILQKLLTFFQQKIMAYLRN